MSTLSVKGPLLASRTLVRIATGSALGCAGFLSLLIHSPASADPAFPALPYHSSPEGSIDENDASPDNSSDSVSPLPEGIKNPYISGPLTNIGGPDLPHDQNSDNPDLSSVLGHVLGDSPALSDQPDSGLGPAGPLQQVGKAVGEALGDTGQSATTEQIGRVLDGVLQSHPGSLQPGATAGNTVPLMDLVQQGLIPLAQGLGSPEGE